MKKILLVSIPDSESLSQYMKLLHKVMHVQLGVCRLGRPRNDSIGADESGFAPQLQGQHKISIKVSISVKPFQI